jgi:hypothetical protein
MAIAFDPALDLAFDFDFDLDPHANPQGLHKCALRHSRFRVVVVLDLTSPSKNVCINQNKI